MKEKEQIQNILKSGPLKEIKCYKVNKALQDIQMEKAFFVDGGIELVFQKGSISAAWHTEYESLVIGPNTFEEVYQQENASPLQIGSLVEEFIGLNVSDYFLIKSQYEMIEEDMMEVNEVEINMELNILFENGHNLQIALVDYDLSNFVPSNFIYDLNADILVNCGERVLMKNEE